MFPPRCKGNGLHIKLYCTAPGECFPQAILNFLSPVSINRLLTYLEDGGEDAVVRPWVWFLFLFFGPVIGSIMHEGYILPFPLQIQLDS